MRQVHIRVDDELYNELNSYSEKNELSMQDCVREAVAYYMSDAKKKENKGKAEAAAARMPFFRKKRFGRSGKKL